MSAIILCIQPGRLILCCRCRVRIIPKAVNTFQNSESLMSKSRDVASYGASKFGAPIINSSHNRDDRRHMAVVRDHAEEPGTPADLRLSTEMDDAKTVDKKKNFMGDVRPETLPAHLCCGSRVFWRHFGRDPDVIWSLFYPDHHRITSGSLVCRLTRDLDVIWSLDQSELFSEQ